MLNLITDLMCEVLHMYPACIPLTSYNVYLHALAEPLKVPGVKYHFNGIPRKFILPYRWSTSIEQYRTDKHIVACMITL